MWAKRLKFTITKHINNFSCCEQSVSFTFSEMRPSWISYRNAWYNFTQFFMTKTSTPFQSLFLVNDVPMLLLYPYNSTTVCSKNNLLFTLTNYILSFCFYLINNFYSKIITNLLLLPINLTHIYPPPLLTCY